MNDYSKLQELAESATKGPWGYDGSYVCPARTEDGTTYVESWRSVADCAQPENTKFIAAANPTAILGLLAEIDRLKVHDSLLAVWMEKTEWIQTTCHGRELGMHRADAILSRIDCLKAEVARLRTAEGDAMTYKAGMENVAQQRDQLKQENRLLTEHNEFLASSDSRLAPELRAVKDALGLDFTASVSGEVVPLIERLRKLPTCWTEVLEQSEANDQLLDQVLELSKDAERYRWLRTQNIPLNGHDFLSSHEILDRRVDAKIAAGAEK